MYLFKIIWLFLIETYLNSNMYILLMADPISLFQALIDPLQIVMNRIQVLVGGVFGLYFLFFVYKVYAMKKQKQMFLEIRADISAIKRRLVIQDLNRNQEKHKENENKRKSKNSK